MADPDFPKWFLEEHPYAQLNEVIFRIRGRLFSEEDDPHPTLAVGYCCRLLYSALVQGRITGYGSVDSSPISPIDAWAWHEYDIHTAGNDAFKEYEISSIRAYRAAALKNLSHPSTTKVPGPNGPEQGYYRVIDKLMFFEKDVQKVFPAKELAAGEALQPSGKYADYLRRIEGGKYLYSPRPHSIAQIRDKVCELLGQNGAHVMPETIEKGLSRHYEKFAAP